MKIYSLVVWLALGLLGQSPQLGDAAVWSQFELWVSELPALPPGQQIAIGDRFVKYLSENGVDEAEARRRFARANVLRRESDEKERVYWNGAFKSGGGPDAPLRLLQETVRWMKPGRALDAGMGRGRNAIFLASLGWEVTGYDLSPDALKIAQAAADAAKVKIQTKEARHDSFDFGETQWDLILCSYNYMTLFDDHWPTVFLKALKPGGVVVFQASNPRRVTLAEQAVRWKGFRLLRFADLDAGVVDDDWGPSKTNPTGMLVARKE